MKLSALQMEVKFGDVEENFRHAEALFIEAMQDAPDTVIFPELWSTGFYPRPITDYADAEGARGRAFLADLARQYRVNIVGGSVPVLENGKIYNQCDVFDRKGIRVHSYRKAHLFSPTGEHQDFAAGDAADIFTLDGIPCGAALCYDVRFPEFIRMMALKGAAIIFLSAAWPKVRIFHWEALTRARAIENQLFLVALNGAHARGEQDENALGGQSAIYGPWGEILAEAGGEEAILSAELHTEEREKIRMRINVFRDRREEIYNLRTK